MFDILFTIFSAIASSAIGFFVGLVFIRYFGKLMTDAFFKSLTENVNKKNSLFKIEYDNQNIQFSVNIPKLIAAIKNTFNKKENDDEKQN